MGSWLTMTLGAGKPEQHSWEPREPDWQAQLQPMGRRPALAARVEFHSCCLGFFSFSPCCAFPLCLWDCIGGCTDGVLESKAFAHWIWDSTVLSNHFLPLPTTTPAPCHGWAFMTPNLLSTQPALLYQGVLCCVLFYALAFCCPYRLVYEAF